MAAKVKQIGKIELQIVKADAESRFFPWVVDEITIENDEQLKNMSDLLAIGKAIEKEAVAKLKEIIDPLRIQAKEARDAFKPLQNRIALGISRIDSAIISYHQKKKEEAEQLLITQMQEQAQRIADSKETGEIVELEQRVTQPVSNTIRGNMGTTGIRETAEFTVVDEDKVPPELKTTDLKKVKAWYALGHKDIPGILITIKQSTVSRFG